MNHKEALKKIIEVTLDQSTANKIATEALQSESELKEYGLDEVSKIAQWVIDNRYPKNENNKVSDFEMYYKIIELIQSLQPESERMYEIEFDRGLKTVIQVTDSGIKIISAVDGWGCNIEDEFITIQSLPKTPKI